MIDGVKCSCKGLTGNEWLNNKALDFAIAVSESTGEVLSGRKEAKSGAFCFALSPQPDNTYNCSINGSLHKYHKGSNFDDFTFKELHRSLEDLSNEYDIDLKQSELHGLEIGVNLELNYSPKSILKSALCHKGKLFSDISSKDKHLGIIVEHSDYAIKLYDKGRQSRISRNKQYILRCEIKCKRQRMFNQFGVKTLADLQRIENVAPLILLLLDKIQDVVFFDFSFDSSGLTSKQQIDWIKLSNPKYWEILAETDRKKYYKQRKKYEHLVKKYGAKDGKELLSTRILEKWIDLLEIKQEKGRRFPQIIQTLKSRKGATFSKLVYLMEIVPFGGERVAEKKEEKEARFCLSCGRDISNQKKGSRFCSEKLYGKQAKKCRNKDSNRRLSIRRKINRATETKSTIKVIYKDFSGLSYFDLLGLSVNPPNKARLDNIVNVEIYKSSRRIRDIP